ncbi:alpha-2-macroglobulin family protein [Lignipirellula cremea]|uniref:alpha-2-macroglobulin family protein n=1 Tax=Lignipirellula cremea TaxID=2528010 RepID=UPI0018D2172B|nr:alpha-2-macroglobulin family protein [Lignipirellula cremea]
MKIRPVALALLFLFSAVLLAAPVGSPEEEWQAVDKAIQQGLPKTAIEKLQPIIDRTLKEKDYDEAIKAIGQKTAMETNIQGNLPEVKIRLWEAEIQRAPAPMKPVMQAVLANWYQHYFQQNRWRIMQRTATAAPPGDDFTTWDLPRILAEIDKHFDAALADAKTLQQTPIGDYDELLEKGTASDAHRPTLYDFLAYDAIDFYLQGEQAGALPQDNFALEASSPVFSPVADFLAWKPETTDASSPTLKALKLYQDLLRFHQNDDDKTAFLDADLHRLAFGNSKAEGEEKTARYKAALRRFIQQHGDHEISARALLALATTFHGEGDWVEARKIAQQGLTQFPQSIGGRGCFNLIQTIEARSLHIVTERVWNKPLPTIDIRYRNLNKLYFRLVRVDYEDFVKRGVFQPEQVDGEQRQALLAQKPDKEWSIDLPATEDFKETTEQIPAPADMPLGSYYLIASAKPDFGPQDNVVSLAEVWVSNLALVTRTDYSQAVVGGQVLHAVTGAPIAKATVRAWKRNNSNNRMQLLKTIQTDKDGLFELSDGPQNQYVVLHVQQGDDSLPSANYLYSYHARSNPQAYPATIFFTDRALYRPGQTVHFKGICIQVNPQADNYKTSPGRTVKVVFNDPNGKEIERLELKANDYGSVSGSFTAPRDRLLGRMSIHVDGEPRSSTQIRVEEYKRPKFRVEMPAPRTAARLNDKVELLGKATAYTGAPIDHAQVTWRVVRQVEYPRWYYYSRWWAPPQANRQEIAHGTAQTAVNGEFPVSFDAVPDPSAKEDSGAVFTYSITADVTDPTGETRSVQRSIKVGFTALAASLTIDSWQTTGKPVDIKVTTATLDGEPQAANGTLTVFRLEQPETVQRASLTGNSRWRLPAKDAAAEPDPADPNTWKNGESVFEKEIAIDVQGSTTVPVELASGYYRAKFIANDRFGKPVQAETLVMVLDLNAKKLAFKLPDLLTAPTWSLEPGEELQAVWGTGYDEGQAFVEIEHRGKVLKKYWTTPGRTQEVIRLPIDESLRGGFTLRVTMVRENRAYLHSQQITVPWTNKELKVKWEHFVSKLEPGQKETWTAVISGPDAQTAVAEMVATLYDASLDAFAPNNWRSGFNVFRTDGSSLNWQFQNQPRYLQQMVNSWSVPQKDATLTYRQLPGAIFGNFAYYGWNNNRRAALASAGAPQKSEKKMSVGRELQQSDAQRKNASDRSDAKGDAGQDKGQAGPDLDQVAARTNLNETAFFFPHLVSDSKGEVKLEFTMPEALTEWKFFGFAHDNELRAGLLTDTVVTAKDLMIQPNPPRFVREGDEIEFTVKVVNQSPTRQTGTVRLSLSDARTMNAVDDQLGNKTRDQAFDVPAGESRTYAWRLQIPEYSGFLIYRAVGSSAKLSDGEEGYLPVLSRRILVTESVTLPIRGPGTKQFELPGLVESAGSKTLQSQSLSVQMVSNPSWYAVMALPYLMEYPHQCSEQTFNRLYANSLARHLANSDPKIRRVFDQWRGTPALDSPLAKNQDLKAVMLEETPWLRDSDAESQARRNVGILFDSNRLNEETSRLLAKLADQQLADGAWPWFPGGPANDFITLYITTGFGRLRHLGAGVEVTSAVKSLTRLDGWLDRQYREAQKHNPEKNHLNSTIALYLYGRSFFLDDQAIGAPHQAAVDYYLGQARKYWLELDCRQSQGHLALALKRFGDLKTPAGIMASLKERSVSDEELGMFWRDQELSYWWFRAPIETQAVMIEAFDEVANDQASVEDCKVWLLKQKQTQDWKTTKATADAVYALLLRGTDLLASDKIVQVALGGEWVKPESLEAGTGFYEERLGRGEIRPQQGKITVKKVDQGVAWGSVTWQYLEQMDKVKPHTGTPLTLEKSLFVKRNTKDGPVLEAVTGPVDVGDELVVRVVLRSDRDMEYLHLKDYRGSGTEPVNVLSQYKYQDGLAYYESTRDTASHFFIDYLPKGTYVFEYSNRVQLRGEYETGVASIQCMYAPEFNSHSASVGLKVK